MNKNFFSDNEKNFYIKSYIEKQLLKYGEINYVYSVMNKVNISNMVVISSLPEESVDDYLRDEKQNTDPFIVNALNSIAPFCWDKNINISSRWTVKSIFTPVNNITSGYAFVLHDHEDNLAILSLYISNSFTNKDSDLIEKNKDELHFLLIRIHEMLLNVYREKKVLSH